MTSKQTTIKKERDLYSYDLKSKECMTAILLNTLKNEYSRFKNKYFDLTKEEFEEAINNAYLEIYKINFDKYTASKTTNAYIFKNYMYVIISNKIKNARRNDYKPLENDIDTHYTYYQNKALEANYELKDIELNDNKLYYHLFDSNEIKTETQELINKLSEILTEFELKEVITYITRSKKEVYHQQIDRTNLSLLRKKIKYYLKYYDSLNKLDIKHQVLARVAKLYKNNLIND